MAHNLNVKEDAVSTSTVAQPRAGEIGKPERKWYIVPSVIPVPPAPAREDAPAPREVPVPEYEPKPERVPA